MERSGQHLCGGNEENYKNYQSGCQYPNRDSNQALPEYTSDMLPLDTPRLLPYLKISTLCVHLKESYISCYQPVFKWYLTVQKDLHFTDLWWKDWYETFAICSCIHFIQQWIHNRKPCNGIHHPSQLCCIQQHSYSNFLLTSSIRAMSLPCDI